MSAIVAVIRAVDAYSLGARSAHASFELAVTLEEDAEDPVDVAFDCFTAALERSGYQLVPLPD